MVKAKQDKYILGYSEKKNISSYNSMIKLDISLASASITLPSTIEGQVLDFYNIPVKDALVRIADVNFDSVAYTFTNSNGYYIFHNIKPSESYVIFAIAKDKKLNQLPTFSLLPSENKIINFKLENDPALRLGIICGNVKDQSKKAISGTVISLYNNVNSLYAITYSNEYGQFAFREIIDGKYTVKVSAPGYISSSYDIEISETFHIVSISIELINDPNSSRGTISGIITDDNHIPINRADVILYKVESNSNQFPISYAKTNSSGVYLFTNLSYGNYKIMCNQSETIEVLVSGPSGPNINKLTILSTLYKSSLYKREIDVESINLTGSAVLNNGFIEHIGGRGDGAINFDYFAPIDGFYDLVINYTAENSSKKLEIISNDITQRIIGFEATDSLMHFHAKEKKTSLYLNYGKNNIRLQR